MLTAEQIAKKTGIDLRAVRYRLSELRRKSKIKCEQFGQTYAYPPSIIKKVKNFDRKKG